MADFPAIADLRFTASNDADSARGLLGFVSFALGPVRLDGVTVRRTRDGRLTLSFPVRRDADGRAHALVRPLDDEARRSLEAQVFAALDLKHEPST